MIRSLFRRLLHAFVLLGLISIIAFGLSKCVPGDEILDFLSIDDPRYSSSADPWQQRMAYARVAGKRGLDLPYFYVSVSPGYYPDSLYTIFPAEDRATLKAWINSSKDTRAATQLYTDLVSGLAYSCPRSDTSPLALQFCQQIHQLLSTRDRFSVHHGVLQLKTFIDQSGKKEPTFDALVSTLNADAEALIHSPGKVTPVEWLPVIRWHGAGNQYHQWMAGCITFKPLTSLVDGRNAWTKILVALKWTLLLNGLAFLLAIVLGTVIGIWSGTHDGHWMERVLNIKLFALYALPSFWLATLLIFLLSSGEWLTIFPSGGLGPYQAADHFFEKAWILTRHLFLPVVCLAIGSLAYVSRQMKQSVLHQFDQPYVMSLRTMGISEKTILRKHIIRNALFPMITMIGGALPALLSGSLIIEVIFSIPGMGRLMYTSLVSRDWPVVFPILMFAATITVLSYILTDVIYKWADPRVKSIGS